ncbi:MAG: cation diffusion facilitator family transporter [Erysipelotrichaceae bacterium]|nr:cation diffusion facilitator family transporter [Erysipelotrichaceae bacterium]
MITLLRKLFIKDYKNVNNPKVRERHGILAALGGVFINLLLFTFKLIIGLLTVSMSIISDALNNLTDLFSCFVNLFGFKIASKPADKEHPYGHERVEYIAGMIVSFIIVAVAILLGYTSIMKLIQHDSELDFSNSTWAFVILGGAILAKLLLGFFYYGIGKAINSVTLKASMQDSLNDVLCTSAVLIATIIQFFFRELWWLDPAMSIVVALFILYSGIKMIFETASPLIGLSPDSEFVKTILDDIRSRDGVLGIHDLVIHSYGPTKVFITIHVEVDGYSDMFVAHDVIDNIEDEISHKYGVELTIHMDPIDTKNKEIPLLKEKITSILEGIDKDIKFHDLRLVAGPSHTNILFDVVVPPNTKINIDELSKKVVESVDHLNKCYHCIIKIDQNYLD